jgi:CBS domain-containing protein
MTNIEPKYMLSELRVRQAMRRIATSIAAETTIEQAVRCSIKNKISAIVVTDRSFRPVGVVSKTDMVSAYYAGVPIGSAVGTIMNAPPVCCTPEDSLDRVLKIMREKSIHRVYVLDEEREAGTGVISYSDIVGLLYRCCHKCERNLRRKTPAGEPDATDPVKVREVMTPSVCTIEEYATLHEVIEDLFLHRFGAILVTWSGQPAGVVSKTDLILAYRHGVPANAMARSIMRSPVRSCDENVELAPAIRQMIFWDIKRFFVYKGDPDEIVGVISLTDAAQARSGSCRACMPSRIEVL